MTDLRTAAQLALEALSFSCPVPDLISKHNAAESALKAALEQTQGCVEEDMLDYETELLNLLCRIHRDGGQYIDTHGLTKALIDADLKVSILNSLLDSIGDHTAMLEKYLGSVS